MTFRSGTIYRAAYSDVDWEIETIDDVARYGEWIVGVCAIEKALMVIYGYLWLLLYCGG
jgi:hypothetical protein